MFSRIQHSAFCGLLLLVLSGCGGGGGSAAPSVEILYSFGSSSTDGMNPTGQLLQGSDGNFYGTTDHGGIIEDLLGNGTVFRVTPMGEETILHLFAGNRSDGMNPTVLIQGRDGNFYGTTSGGGATESGIVFKLTPAGVETVLLVLGGSGVGGLVQGTDGNLYGNTDGGEYGTIFEVTPEGVEKTLYAFKGPSHGDGWYPNGQLIQASDGNFYGVTNLGGANDYGIVFRVTPDGVETILHSFSGSDGAYPTAGVIQGKDGNFYGTASQYGTGETAAGTVFKLTSEGIETTLYTFSGGEDGAYPVAGITQGSDGSFFGTTTNGGTNQGGTLFQLAAGGITVLYTFPKDSQPYTNLVQGSDGNLYGTARGAGENNDGYFFRLSPE